MRAEYIGRAPGRGPEGTGNCSSCYVHRVPSPGLGAPARSDAAFTESSFKLTERARPGCGASRALIRPGARRRGPPDAACGPAFKLDAAAGGAGPGLQWKVNFWLRVSRFDEKPEARKPGLTRTLTRAGSGSRRAGIESDSAVVGAILR